MAGDTTLGLVRYYSNLLVSQYADKSAAAATIETTVTPVIMPQISVYEILFNPIPVSGQFELAFDAGGAFATINWNDSAATIQTALRTLPFAVVSGGDAFTLAYANQIFGGTASTEVFQNVLYGGNAFGFGNDSILVSGSIASGTLVVTMAGVTPPSPELLLLGTSLSDGVTTVIPLIIQVDQTLPLAVNAGYSLT